MSKAVKVRVGDLVMDENLLALRPLNIFFVGLYRQHYREGVDMGRPLVERGTNRVVCGNHRVTALLQEFGPDHKEAVDYRKFKDEREVLEVFTLSNVAHGNALSGFSRRQISLKLLDYGATKEEIARMFGIAVRRIEEWGGVVVGVLDGSRTGLAPAKRGMPAGTKMTSEQYQEHMRKDRAISVHSQAEQLTRWITNGWVRPDDARSMEALARLAGAINEFLGRGGARKRRAS